MRSFFFIYPGWAITFWNLSHGIVLVYPPVLFVLKLLKLKNAWGLAATEEKEEETIEKLKMVREREMKGRMRQR